MVGEVQDEGGPGGSARREARRAAARAHDLAAELRRVDSRASGFAAAALSEPRTAAALGWLSGRGWQILHDRQWPGSRHGNVDHLAIGPIGVTVLDTKHWVGSIQVRDGRLWCDDDDRHETVEDLLRLVGAIDELLEEITTSGPGVTVGLSPIHVMPVLVFTRYNEANQRQPRIGRVWLANPRDVARLLTRQPHVLSANQVALIGEYLAREMPPVHDGTQIPTQRRAPIAVPLRPEPPPLPEPPQPQEPDGLFDAADLEARLERAAAQPLVEWMGFLHPSQNRLVRRCYNGPARVRGPAGTGKTVVMLHRAAWLATIRPGRVLVTSYVRTLPTHLRPVYQRLSPHTADKVDFLGIHQVARQLLADGGQPLTTKQTAIDAAFTTAWERVGGARGPLAAICSSRQYWREEIDNVIKGRGLRTPTEYEYLERRGRVISLTGQERNHVWELLDAYTDELERRGTHDHNDVLSMAVDLVDQARPEPGWSAVLIDEVQDLPLLALKLCRLLAGTGTDGLFLVGDGQQALYTGGFTLAEADLSVLGRATVLRLNYRNTRQILDSALELVLDHEFFDLDATSEPGSRDIEVLRTGPPPVRRAAPHRRGLVTQLRLALIGDRRDGIDYGEMAILTHTNDDLAFLRAYLARHGFPVTDLATWNGEPDHNIKLGTIHRAKGLDFSAVYLPEFAQAASPGTSPDEHERHARRRRQSFVGRSRARDRLWIGTITPAANLPIRSPANAPSRQERKR